MVKIIHDVIGSGRGNFIGRYVLDYIPGQENVKEDEKFPIVLNFIYGDRNKVTTETAIILHRKIFSQVYKQVEFRNGEPHNHLSSLVDKLNNRHNLYSLFSSKNIPLYIKNELARTFNVKELIKEFIKN